jgi:hypothetical protein
MPTKPTQESSMLRDLHVRIIFITFLSTVCVLRSPLQLLQLLRQSSCGTLQAIFIRQIKRERNAPSVQFGKLFCFGIHSRKLAVYQTEVHEIFDNLFFRCHSCLQGEGGGGRFKGV